MANINGYEINKATVRSVGDLNRLVDTTQMVQDLPDLPQLLGQIVPMREEMLTNDLFEHDFRTTNVNQIEDSPYHERGNYVGKETNNTHQFRVPHHAIQGRVRPRDVRAVRMPGTDQTYDTLDRQIAVETANMRNAFAAFDELQLARTITNGTMYAPNGTVPAYDFYQEYTGTAATSRPTVDFDLSTVTTRPGEKGELVRKMLRNGLRNGDTMSGVMAIVGNNFFSNLIYHENIITPRENYAADTQNPLLRRLNDMGMDYRIFVGPDNITYINYDGAIGVDPLIGANDAYFMPTGNVDIFRKAYAPAETVDYVNTLALREYMWRLDDPFEGTKLYTERNSGVYLINPSLIIKGTA